MKSTQYHKALTEEMLKLSKNHKTIFLGQQVVSEDFYNTLTDVPMHCRRETPVVEEMQLGISIGLSLEGYLPISIFQRIDFLPRACDQLVNHLDLIPSLSRNMYIPKVIIRTTIGSTKPLDVGLQHNKNLILGFRRLLKTIPIFELLTPKDIHKYYKLAQERKESTILVEYQDLYYEEER